MYFIPTPLPGAYVIELDRRGDSRGWFARSFCAREFESQGLVRHFVQANTSLSIEPGTVRGIHYQRAPAAETKLVRCIQGAMWDVIVDARESSATYLQSFGTELSSENGKQMYVPLGFAHGFMTLEPGTVAAYMVDQFYTPGVEAGFRYDDPRLGRST
jgi:dTDP-4-dehydrorhamnose 3,5-epimerase